MSGEERPTLFLVAHKVRGEPAFDIAITVEIGDENGWIIPTSGHRAYPYWSMPLEQISRESTFIYCEDDPFKAIPDMPPDLPDHYSTSASPRTADPTAARNLLSSLGLIKPAEPIKRRV